MGDISAHFSRHEFACRCGCGYSDISPELVSLLETLRMAFNAPVSINSGCRCRDHNRAVGGKPLSQHLTGNAADIVVSSTSPAEVYQWLDQKYPNTLGLGLYGRFVHVDVRHNRARWRG